jgi:hypothetical protein
MVSALNTTHGWESRGRVVAKTWHLRAFRKVKMQLLFSDLEESG